MSIFKTKAIVLHGKKIWEKDFLYTLFTQEYGKIRCNKKISKSEKSLDIWYIIHIEISTQDKSNIHKIRNIKIISEYPQWNTEFQILNSYLEAINFLYRQIPEGIAHQEIFHIIEYINSPLYNQEIKFILMQLKISFFLWNLTDTHEDGITQKILKFIHTHPIENILKLSWVQEEQKYLLKQLLE